MPLLNSQLREQINNVRMEVSPCGVGRATSVVSPKIKKNYRQGKATAQTQTMSAVSDVSITTLAYCLCNLNVIVCIRWNLVTNNNNY